MGWMKDKRRREREAKQPREAEWWYEQEQLDWKPGMPLTITNDPSSYVLGEFIVAFDHTPNITKDRTQYVMFNDIGLDQLSERHNIIDFRYMLNPNFIVLKSSNGNISDAVAEFRSNQKVNAADFNHKRYYDNAISINMPTNHYAPQNDRWDSQWNLYSMRLPEAWSYGIGNADVRIAVVDSGLRFSPDPAWPSGGWEQNLYDALDPLYYQYLHTSLQQYDYIGGNYIIQNPYHIHGLDYTHDEYCDDFHGTMVAATAVGNHENSDTPAGVCPGCKLFVIKQGVGGIECVGNSQFVDWGGWCGPTNGCGADDCAGVCGAEICVVNTTCAWNWDCWCLECSCLCAGGQCPIMTVEQTINSLTLACSDEELGTCECVDVSEPNMPPIWNPTVSGNQCWGAETEPICSFDGSCTCTNRYYHPRTIVNMSYGDVEYNGAEANAIEDALSNCIIVASAGNDGFQNHYPSGYPGVVSAGAVTYHWLDEYNDVLVQTCADEPMT